MTLLTRPELEFQISQCNANAYISIKFVKLTFQDTLVMQISFELEVWKYVHMLTRQWV